MKLFWLAALLVFSFLIAKAEQTVLLVPLQADQVVFNRSTERMLKHNNVTPLEAQQEVVRIIGKSISENLSHYRLINLEFDTAYQYLVKHTTPLQEWQSFKIKKISSHTGYDRYLFVDKNSDNTYLGRPFREVEKMPFKALKKNHNVSFTIFINKFEIRRSGFLARKNSFILHIEIYDEDFRKVYGGKASSEHHIRKKMHFNVFKHFIRKNADAFFKDMSNFLLTEKPEP